MDMSSMSSMSMVFTNDHSTPLFSAQWTPTTTGAYAATCIFLVVLAVISRTLSAWRLSLEQRWHDRAIQRRYIVLAAEDPSSPAAGLPVSSNEKSDEALLTTRGVDERVRVVRSARRGIERTPWRFSTDLPRAAVFTVQAGVGYLLMLAVMALNVGYFLSVLGGLFLGELVIGRFAVAEDGHH